MRVCGCEGVCIVRVCVLRGCVYCEGVCIVRVCGCEGVCCEFTILNLLLY